MSKKNIFSFFSFSCRTSQTKREVIFMEKTAKTSITTEYTWEERAKIAETKLDNALDEIEYLKARIRLLQAKRFGASSEKNKDHRDQTKLFENVFNEAEATAEPLAPEPELITVPEHKRKKRTKRGASLEGLPEEIIEYHLHEEEMSCPCCGNRRHVIGQDTTKEVVYEPAQLFARVHVRYVYGCHTCEKDSDGTQPVVVKAPKPNRAFPGSIASPSVVAHVINEKYVMGSPFYRQEQQWARSGVSLSRQNMANWTIYAAENWFEPLYERMKAELLAKDLLNADETSIQVLKEDGKAAESKSFMWLYRTGRYDPAITLFEYQPSRAKEHPREFLKDFEGFLQTDAYAGYDGLEGVINVGCWAHAKRKYDDAIKATGARGKNSKAQEGLKHCQKLYKIEKNIRHLGPEERYQKRLLESKPVLEAYLAWLHKTKNEVLPQSHLGKAIQYSLNHWTALNNFLLDGRLEIDNNLAERTIKPFVIARKNFLFVDNPRGAKASAIIFSIIESAKDNGLNPFKYIEYLLEKLPNSTSSELDRCLPWSEDLPEFCRTPKKKK